MNKLSNETSLYLLSHAQNPVNWYAWGEEALLKAKEENKIIIISIGYSSCHWCHVMNRESFSDIRVAEMMNRHFINIKVDREERTDIDQLYMNAVQMLTHRGGWPLNCFALSDGSPFFGGTYFQKEHWLELLEKLEEIWIKEPNKIIRQAEQISSAVDELPLRFLQQNNYHNYKEATQEVKEKLLYDSDSLYGGLKGAPKFLMPEHLQFLMNFCFFQNEPNIEKYIQTTLQKFAQGGIHDFLAGGFSRYSVDKFWKIPHFEKTLYDNAQIISLYVKASKIWKNEKHLEIAEKTAHFVLRDLISPDNLFYSGIDADSEGEEGKFYVWEREEFETIFGEEAHLFIDWFGIDIEGLWELNKSVLIEWQDEQKFCQQNNLSIAKWQKMLAEAKNKLYKYRQNRIKPKTDTNLIVSWNCMMVNALIDLFNVTEHTKYLESSIFLVEVLLDKMWIPNKKVWRVFNPNSKNSNDGFLDDYVNFADALINLYLITNNSKYLNFSISVLNATRELFKWKDQNLLKYHTTKGDLFAESVEIFDNVIPSSNSVAAITFLKAGIICSEKSFIEQSKRMAIAGMYASSSSPTASYNWANLFLMLHYEPLIAKVSGLKKMEKMHEIRRTHFPFVWFLELETNHFTDQELTIDVCGSDKCFTPYHSLDSFINDRKKETF